MTTVKVVGKYETMFILDTALTDEQLEALLEKFKTLIGSAGEIETVDVWGKRRLAYTINYKTEGYYVLINFSADTEFPKELDRIFKITDGVIRSMIVRKS